MKNNEFSVGSANLAKQKSESLPFSKLAYNFGQAEEKG